MIHACQGVLTLRTAQWTLQRDFDVSVTHEFIYGEACVANGLFTQVPT